MAEKAMKKVFTDLTRHPKRNIPRTQLVHHSGFWPHRSAVRRFRLAFSRLIVHRSKPPRLWPKVINASTSSRRPRVDTKPPRGARCRAGGDAVRGATPCGWRGRRLRGPPGIVCVEACELTASGPARMSSSDQALPTTQLALHLGNACPQR